jgi:hypothetical protein
LYHPAEPYIFLHSFLAMSQELDAQMQLAPAANPAVDAWRQLADLISIAKGVAPATSSRPSIPAGTPSGFAASIHRAYRRGGQAYHQPNLDLEPEIPTDAGTSKCAVALWEFFWQGYRYSEMVATTKVPACGSGSSNASSKDAKINKPETFNGQRDKFADFVVQLHLVFNNEKAAFRNDNAKISYTGALLRGAAKQWFTPHVNQETGAIAFTSWAQSMKRFRASFQDSDEKTAAERMLLNLQQGTEPCASYHACFVSYMATLDWDENSQIATFRRGLRPEIKDLLVGRDLPDTFNEYVSLCIRLDNSWREREQDRQNSGGRVARITTRSASDSHSGGNSTAVGTHSGPMDISAGRRGPLSKKERSHRKANNLCMYCGKNGHFASTCPESSRNNKGKQRVSAAITASPTPATSPASAAPTAAPNASVWYAAAGH